LTARELFWDSTGTVRPPWRLAIFAAVGFASLIVVNGAIAPFVAGAIAMTGARVVLYPWVLLLAAVLAHVFTFRLIEPRGWSVVALGESALRPGPIAHAGVLGAVAVGLPCLLLIAVGWLDVTKSVEGSSLGLAASTAVFLAPAAFWEELMFRGYGFAVLVEWWGRRAALGVTSAIFGLVHLQNVGATWASVAVVALAGLFLGGVLLVTRSLYAAFAAHFAWNWTLAAVLHTAVSGIPFATPDYRVIDAGPDWATGGVWGPEGGVPAALGLLGATIYLYLRRGRREES
jgi:membrane protease YdiL (CAAX protease family)